MMLVRAITLSLALLLGIGSVIPFIFHDTAEAKPRYKNKKHKKIRKYSKAWWRWYHRQQRKKRAILARKRSLRAKQIILARKANNQNNTFSSLKKTEKNSALNTPKENPAPNFEQEISFNDEKGKLVGSAQLAVIGQSAINDSLNDQNKIGGIPTSSLRRNVVDKMVKENGWVVNDYHKIINGKKVYLVVAQSPVNGSIQTRFFYFTEKDGKVYSLSSTAPKEKQEKVSQESEKMLHNLQQTNNQVGLK